MRSSDRPTRSGTKRRHGKPLATGRPTLEVMPGYTVLVIDTNILLSSLSVVSSLVESNRWTVVIPLAGMFRFLTKLRGVTHLRRLQRSPSLTVSPRTLLLWATLLAKHSRILSLPPLPIPHRLKFRLPRAITFVPSLSVPRILTSVSIPMPIRPWMT